MLNTMQQQDWPEKCTIIVWDFWLALESHEWRHNPSKFRKWALLVYQGKIHRDWHKIIGTLDSFSLLLLEQEHLWAFHQELLANVYISKIEFFITVSIIFIHNQPTNNQLFCHHILPLVFIYPFVKFPWHTHPDPVCGFFCYTSIWSCLAKCSFLLLSRNGMLSSCCTNLSVQGKSDPTVLIPLEHPEAMQWQPLQKAHLFSFERFVWHFHDKEVAFFLSWSRKRLCHLRARQFPVHPASLSSLSQVPKPWHASHSLSSQMHLKWPVQNLMWGHEQGTVPKRQRKIIMQPMAERRRLPQETW